MKQRSNFDVLKGITKEFIAYYATAIAIGTAVITISRNIRDILEKDARVKAAKSN